MLCFKSSGSKNKLQIFLSFKDEILKGLRLAQRNYLVHGGSRAYEISI